MSTEVSGDPFWELFTTEATEPGFELLYQTGIFCEPSMKEPVSYIGGIPYGDASMSHQQVIIPIPGG